MTDDAPRPALVWFRDDLRTTDHAALARAAECGPVVGLYIAEEIPAGESADAPGSPPPGPRPLGAAAKWWLHHSLHVLADDLAGLGIELHVAAGDPRDIVPRLVADLDAIAVTWHRRYAPGARALDAEIEAALPHASTHPGHLLNEPGDVATAQGRPYKVFTPFSRAAADRLGADMSANPDTDPGAGPDGDPDVGVVAVPTQERPRPGGRGVSGGQLRATHAAIDALELTAGGPENPAPNQSADFHRYWTPGEAGAHERLAAFIERLGEGPTPSDRRQSTADLEHRYATGRDYMALDATSRLSPHLRFGEISPRQAWDAIAGAVDAGSIDAADGRAFQRELLWRDFAWHRRHHLPNLETANTRSAFDAFPWARLPEDGDDATTNSTEGDDALREALAAWRNGTTGFGLVDAGMRELLATGHMHNRVRMVVGSLLTKNLGIHWRHGEEWFWDRLVDADEASNPFNWQWVAGCGDDAAPYFRIFNPETQARRYDSTAAYIRRWVPEYGTPAYPAPIVDLRESRAAALAAYEAMKNAG
ncbi:cryptochrome/photolyase family protein [Corynebacterium hansenii]|uniref:Cryptochrome/photolyase family protein n=1 Tax=Corynebacterium hansenii TaxID=394964 RepID=A0ABV7ZLZ4_9CORY|nr:deoxyribodipyrimidine photo-lyase [Corynebacterium hansenii]WJY99366.1 Deoxyribodipyrimidine photo-lyase [Corynebacterium hansenii]